MADIQEISLVELPVATSIKDGVLHVYLNGADYSFPSKLLVQSENNLGDVDATQARKNLNLMSSDEVGLAIKAVTDSLNNTVAQLATEYFPVYDHKIVILNILIQDLVKKTSPVLKYGTALIGELIAWPLAKMPNEIWTDLGQTYLPYINQKFDTTAFPQLAQIHPSGQLPVDMRGEFIRGWDNARGVDSSRTILSSQYGSLVPGDDGIDAETPYTINNINNRSGWGYDTIESNRPTSGLLVSSLNNWSDSQNISINGPGNSAYKGSIKGNSSLIYNVGVTRPRNVAWNYIVRAK